MPREYRVRITNRLSSEWANRKVTIHTSSGSKYIPWSDADILCDLCNKPFPMDNQSPISILQHRWSEDHPWIEVGTRCPECLQKEIKAYNVLGYVRILTMEDVD